MIPYPSTSSIALSLHSVPFVRESRCEHDVSKLARICVPYQPPASVFLQQYLYFDAFVPIVGAGCVVGTKGFHYLTALLFAFRHPPV